jgi:hypothetical protein
MPNVPRCVQQSFTFSISEELAFRPRDAIGVGANCQCVDDSSEGIAISPDGREVSVTSRVDGVISVISTDTDTIVTTFPSGGKEPKRLEFTPDGGQVWITKYKSNEVTVFDSRRTCLVQSLALSPHLSAHQSR